MSTQQGIANARGDNGLSPDIEQKILTDSQTGVVSSWWQLGLGMTEASCTTTYGLAQDVRAEMRRRADAVLAFTEEMVTGTFGFARKVVSRIDRVAEEGLGRGEAAILVVTRTARKTGHGVADLASTALTDTIGAAPGSGPRRQDAPRAASA